MTKQPTDGLDYNTYFYDPLVSIMIYAARLPSCSEGSRILQLPVRYVCRIDMYTEEGGAREGAFTYFKLYTFCVPALGSFL